MRSFLVVLLYITASCSSDEESNANFSAGGAQATSSAGTGAVSGTSGSASTGGSGGSTANSGGNAGTSTSAGSGGTTEADPSAVCNATGAALCARIEQCSPFGLSVAYGDVATCVERFAIGCRVSIEAPGSNTTIAITEACGAALPSLSCDDLIANKLGTACTPPPGRLENDSSCVDDTQCVSSFCARAPDFTCGKCSTATKPDDPCVNQACSRGQACVAGTCIVPTRGKVGDSCTAQEHCDLAGAVGCNTLSGKCIQLTKAKEGEACGAKDLSFSSYGVCEAAGACSASFAGKCAAAADDGETCSTADTGPSCMLPAQCVDSKCEIPTKNACN